MLGPGHILALTDLGLVVVKAEPRSQRNCTPSDVRLYQNIGDGDGRHKACMGCYEVLSAVRRSAQSTGEHTMAVQGGSIVYACLVKTLCSCIDLSAVRS